MPDSSSEPTPALHSAAEGLSYDVLDDDHDDVLCAVTPAWRCSECRARHDAAQAAL